MFKIITDTNHEQVEQRVNKLLARNEGWRIISATATNKDRLSTKQAEKTAFTVFLTNAA